MARKRIPPSEATTEEVYNRLALGDHAERLGGFERALEALNEAVPYRATARQLQAFASIVAANAIGERVTLTDLRGRNAEIAANINKSYQLFLPPSPKDAEALGWVTQHHDANDGRKKYLVLTEAGRAIAVKMAEAMGEI